MRRIAIVGGAGRMGQALASGLSGPEDFEVRFLVDPQAPASLFGATYAERLDAVTASSVDVVVEFSTPESVVCSAKWCATHGVALVVGATGLTDSQRGEVSEASGSVPVVMATNFSLGAVLSERFAVQAAAYFERVEIVELHHDGKVDAPSGTSLSTARAIADARARAHQAPLTDPTTRVTLEGARGADAADGIRVHAVRLPGLVAHQEILFGSPGEGLTIRHDSFDRQSFVQGVALAIRSLSTQPGLTLGIESFVR